MGRERAARIAVETGPKEGLAPPIATRAFRLIPNCAARALGTDASRVHSFQLQMGAPVQLRPVLRVRSRDARFGNSILLPIPIAAGKQIEIANAVAVRRG